MEAQIGVQELTPTLGDFSTSILQFYKNRKEEKRKTTMDIIYLENQEVLKSIEKASTNLSFSGAVKKLLGVFSVVPGSQGGSKTFLDEDKTANGLGWTFCLLFDELPTVFAFSPLDTKSIGGEEGNHKKLEIKETK